MAVTFVVGVLTGALIILFAQALLLLYLFHRFVINKNKVLHKKIYPHQSSSSSTDLDPHQSLHFASIKQGFVWVLSVEKLVLGVAASPQVVSPLRTYASINNDSLILTHSDSSVTVVLLNACSVEAVSATNLPTRKWAKRYPVLVRSKTSSLIYQGNTSFYLYFQTSWDKDSWCKALRIASCQDNQTLKWFHTLTTDFQNYLTSINLGYPSFMKPSLGFYANPLQRDIKIDASSKVKLFWKKISKKTSKSAETKPTWNQLSVREDRKVGEKSQSLPDTFAPSGMVKTPSTRKTFCNSVDEDSVLPFSSSLSLSSSHSHTSLNSETDLDDKFLIDEGTLCWNLLISRLFFDAKNNAAITSSVQARIQRTLSNMRTPNYIGEVVCCGMNLGNLPPYIHGMRVLSTDMNEVWAFEIDVEYSGGLVLDIATRLEVGELEHQKNLDDANSESGSVGVVTSDLLESYEHFKTELESTERRKSDATETEQEGESKFDGLKNMKNIISTSTNGSRWKSILNSVAKQVSQVPLSLGIRISSLRGIMRFHIKPPPSDQIWFGFTSMPDIDFNLESSVGEHKITSGHIALFLVNKFKLAIRETLVLPNCESIGIPWMLAEKDDWAPQKTAPFIWLNQEASGDSTSASEGTNKKHSDEAKTKTESSVVASTDLSVDKHEIGKKIESVDDSFSFSKPSDVMRKPVEELKRPLLKNEQECRVEENAASSRAIINLIGQPHESVEDGGPKRVGRKAKMFDLGKKMGEKLEEKRRHIEEKSRNIVEKMRGP